MSDSRLKRLCLDRNIYIIGTQEEDSDEAKILKSIGYYTAIVLFFTFSMNKY